MRRQWASSIWTPAAAEDTAYLAQRPSFVLHPFTELHITITAPFGADMLQFCTSTLDKLLIQALTLTLIGNMVDKD